MLDVFGKFLRVVRSRGGAAASIEGRKIYILPTRYGVLFGVLLVLLLIGSINYANNPAFLLTFLLAGLFINTIFQTWRNLLGISVQWQGAEPAFAGETAKIRFRLGDGQKRRHYSVQLAFRDEPAVISDIDPSRECVVRLGRQTRERGLLRPGRMTVETRYPLGLLRAWSYLETEASVIVYPRPGEKRTHGGTPSYQGSETGYLGAGTDDFLGHRGYHPGDHPRHLNWKAYASDKGLLVKQFGGDRAELLWLDFNALDGWDTETRLSILCRNVLDLSMDQLYFGLRMPGLEIPPGNGLPHKEVCLQALAMFGKEK